MGPLAKFLSHVESCWGSSPQCHSKDKSLQCSNWDQRPLSPEQICCSAATDCRGGNVLSQQHILIFDCRRCGGFVIEFFIAYFPWKESSMAGKGRDWKMPHVIFEHCEDNIPIAHDNFATRGECSNLYQE